MKKILSFHEAHKRINKQIKNNLKPEKQGMYRIRNTENTKI